MRHRRVRSRAKSGPQERWMVVLVDGGDQGDGLRKLVVSRTKCIVFSGLILGLRTGSSWASSEELIGAARTVYMFCMRGVRGSWMLDHSFRATQNLVLTGRRGFPGSPIPRFQGASGWVSKGRSWPFREAKRRASGLSVVCARVNGLCGSPSPMPNGFTKNAWMMGSSEVFYGALPMGETPVSSASSRSFPR